MTDPAEPQLRYASPRCTSGNILRRQSLLATCVWVGVALFLGAWIAGAGSALGGALALIVMLGFVVAALGAVLAPFSLAFGKNRCKDCGHKWR